MKNRTKILGIVLLPLIAIFMFGIFQLIAFLVGKEAMFEGKELAWYLGFIIYWPLCCVIIPMKLIGKEKIISLYRRSKIKLGSIIIALIPILLTLIGSTFMEYDKVSLLGKLMLLITAFGNGIFEEVLWRGVYVELFPNNSFWGVIWPSIWFAVWHLAPGFVSDTFNPFVLMAGAFVFGLCWSIVAWKSNSIRFSTLSHILTGLVRVFI